MQRCFGCLIDTATGDAIDAGEITLHDNGAIVVAHRQADGSFQTSPYQPNNNRAVLMVPPISPN